MTLAAEAYEILQEFSRAGGLLEMGHPQPRSLNSNTQPRKYVVRSLGAMSSMKTKVEEQMPEASQKRLSLLVADTVEEVGTSCVL